MPYYELLVYLASMGDSVRSCDEHNIYTRHGYRYVRSIEGIEWTGERWAKKYRWNRCA